MFLVNYINMSIFTCVERWKTILVFHSRLTYELSNILISFFFLGLNNLSPYRFSGFVGLIRISTSFFVTN